jgi:exosome complex RNA-binding protein Rrp4
MSLLVKPFELVVPGQLLGEDIKGGENCYKEGNRWFSSVLGFVINNKETETIDIKPVRGVYIPKEGDYVIAEVKATQPNFWIVSLGAYAAKLSQLNFPFKKEAVKEGVFIRGKIINADLSNVEITAKCNECGVLSGGVTVWFDPSKMAKVIGTKGETMEKIKEVSKCEIAYGYNGIIWIRGHTEGIAKVIKILELIELYYYSPKLYELLEKELYVH